MRTFTLLLVALFSLPALANHPQYTRFETTFTAPDGTRPFSELAVDFTTPSGRKIPQPAFYDGGQTYKVRFLPTEPGNHVWTTRSPVPALNGKSGTLSVTPAPKSNRWSTHGPIRVSGNGYHLEHADGTPFFFLADTVWNGAMLSKQDDWPRYLQDRKDKHFTAVQFVLLAPWRTAPANLEGQVAYKLDEAGKAVIQPDYYKRIDDRMDAIEQAGLLAAPVLMWAWGKKDAGQALSEEDCITIIRYQVARYGAHPVLWLLNGDGNYRGPVAERWKRIGAAVFKDLPHHAPVTLHPGGRMWPYNDFADQSWLNVFGYQSSHSSGSDTVKWTHSGPVAKEWQTRPRVYINLEPAYEDHVNGATKKPFTAKEIRQACYWSVLAAPPAGVTYGGHGMWSWQEVEAPPYDHPYTGPARPWHIAKDLDGAKHMKHLHDLFASLPWTQLRPAPDVLAAQPGNENPQKFIPAAATQDRGVCVVYVPDGGEVALKDIPARAELFNPRTGERFGVVERAATIKMPDAEDWVLILRK